MTNIAPFAAGAFTMRETARGLTDMRRAGEALQRQLASGRRSDNFAGLGFERRTSLDARAQLARLESFQATITRTDGRLKATIQAVEQLDRIGADTRTMALDAMSNVRDSQGRPQVQALARNNLAFAVDILNTKFGDNHLFAGRASDERPVLPVGEIMSALEAAIDADPLVSRNDPAGLLAFVDSFFGANSNAWQPAGADRPGTTPPLDARDTVRARIDDGETIAIGARANEDAFRRLLVGLAAMSVADTTSASGMSAEQYDALAREVAAFMSEEPMPRNVAVDLGLAHSRMGAAKERHLASAALLQQAVDGVEGISAEETAISLLTLQTRLQASYQTTASLSRLSLVNFL